MPPRHRGCARQKQSTTLAHRKLCAFHRGLMRAFKTGVPFWKKFRCAWYAAWFPSKSCGLVILMSMCSGESHWGGCRLILAPANLILHSETDLPGVPADGRPSSCLLAMLALRSCLDAEYLCSNVSFCDGQKQCGAKQFLPD